MRLLEQEIPGFFLIEPEVFFDQRGAFRRSFCRATLESAGIFFDALQGNISENTHKHTLRGFHYQKPPFTESKILTCLTGSIWNVVIDLREDSPTFLGHQAISISSENRSSLLIPAGCANAFLTLDDRTTVHYYMGAAFSPERYAGFRYNDPYFGIEWPVLPAIISDRDLAYPDFKIK